MISAHLDATKFGWIETDLLNLHLALGDFRRENKSVFDISQGKDGKKLNAIISEIHATLLKSKQAIEAAASEAKPNEVDTQFWQLLKSSLRTFADDEYIPIESDLVSQTFKMKSGDFNLPTTGPVINTPPNPNFRPQLNPN